MIYCFFEALTAVLLFCVVLLTGMIYKVLTYKADGGVMNLLLLSAFYFLLMLCSVGQNFQNKVRNLFYELHVNDK